MNTPPQGLPPLPPGYRLVTPPSTAPSALPPLPPGYRLDTPPVLDLGTITRSTPPTTAERPAAPNVRGMVSDPDFAKLTPDLQRQALAKLTGDQSFLSLSDAETSEFAQRLGAPGTKTASAQAPPSLLQDTERAANNIAGGALSSFLALPAKLATLPVLEQLNRVDPTRRLLAPLEAKFASAVAPPDPNSFAAKAGAAGEQALELATMGPENLGIDALKGATGAAARIAAGAGAAASDAALHNESPVAGAVGGAAGQGLSELLASAPSVLRGNALTQYARALAPGGKADKFVAPQLIKGYTSPAADVHGLLERGVIAPSGEGLQNVATENATAIGDKITQAVRSVPRSEMLQTGSILKALDEYKGRFMVNGTPINPQGVAAADTLQEIVRQMGPDVSYQSLNRARQILDTAVSEAKGYQGADLAEGSLTDARKAAASAMRRVLGAHRPDIAALNAEYHFWAGVRDVIGATNVRRVGQLGGLIKAIAPVGIGGAGVLAGSIHGVATGGAVGAGAFGVTLAAELMRSTAWRTASAVAKYRLADAIASGSLRDILSAASKLIPASASVASQKTIAVRNPATGALTTLYWGAGRQ